MILYLLPFKTGKEFKFGITRTDRVYDLDKLYGVDLERAKIVRAKNSKTITSIENQIKWEYYDVRSTKYLGTEGWTEILPIEYWDEVLSDIQIKKQKDRLGIQIQDGIIPLKKILKPAKQANQIVSIQYSDYEEELTREEIFYLNHSYGQLLIQAVKCGKIELELPEIDFPRIRDFARRISHLSPHANIEMKTSKTRGTTTSWKKMDVRNYLSIQFDFDSVQFSFSKYFIEDILSGHLEFLMLGSKPAHIENIFYQEAVETESQARAWLKYLTANEEEFKRLCKLMNYQPDIPPSEISNVTRKPIDPRKDIANEKDWKLLWYESRQNEKCSFEEFLIKGGYTKEGDEWIKFY